MKEKAKARLKQLQQERQQVAAQLQQLLAQAEQARHMMSAYDGAIGELSRLLQEATAAASPLPRARPNRRLTTA